MSSDSETLLHRARILRDRNRHEDAAAALIEAIARDPESAEAHCELALVRIEIPGQRKLALESIDEALRIEADSPRVIALKAFILTRLDRDKEALEFADRSIGLDPSDDFAWTVRAWALGGKNRWAEAEESCRKALELDADNGMAANYLAVVLRAQGKLEESGMQVEALLERNAEDPHALATNGWSALQRGDNERAEEFFAEALRLDPGDEHAREGLKQAYKSRSLFYRLFLKFVFFLQRFTEGKQIFIMIGLFLLFRVIKGMVGGSDTAVLIVVALWLLFVSWTSLAPAVGNLLLLKDPRARLTLDPWEKRLALFVGLPFLLVLVLCATTLPFTILGSGTASILFSVTVAGLLACMHGTRIFGNGSTAGRWVFGAAAALALVSIGIHLFFLVNPDIPEESPLPRLGFHTMLASALATWLTFIPNLVKPPDEEFS